MEHEIQRVVSLQPSATVILERLGMLERIVACTRHCLNLCPAAEGVPTVEDSWTAQSHQIRDARPDLVIASVPYQLEALAEILRAGVRVLALAPHNLADVYADISLIANLFEHPERGRDLIAEMKGEIAEVRAATAKSAPRLVYCEEWGKPMMRSQKWVAELVEAAGGRFVGEPATGASAGEIAAADPDVIVAAWCGAGNRVPLEKIVQARSWAELRAVRECRVYCVPDEWLTTPAPTLLEGLKALAAVIHPELFEAPPGVRRIGEIREGCPD